MKQVAYYTDQQKTEFSKRLKALRKHKEISQTIIAEKIGVTLRTYQTYESGQCMPRTDTLISLANYYKIPLPMLLYGTSYFDNNETIFLSYLYYLLTNKKIFAERNFADKLNNFDFVLLTTDDRINQFLNEFDNLYQSKKDKDLIKFDIAEFLEIEDRLEKIANFEDMNTKYRELLK